MQPNRRLRRARLAVLFTFFAAGFALGSWLTRIPAIKDKLGLTEADIGNALFGAALSMMICLPFVGLITERIGSHRTTQLGGMLFSSALILIALAPGYPWLVAALILLGSSNALFNTGQNTQAVLVEDAYERSILTTFHALFSLGFVTAAAVTALVTALEIPVAAHLIPIGLLMGTGMFLSGAWMFDSDHAAGPAPHRAPVFAVPGRAMLALGIVGMCTSFAEGAVGDWSTLYLRDTVAMSDALAPLGFFVYSGLHMTGRLAGDRLKARWGAVRLMRTALVLGLSGLALMILAPRPVTAMLGLAAVGMGFAVFFPLVYAAAGRTPGYTSGRGIAEVATLTQFGFVFGPLIVGQVANAISLRAALGLVAGALLVMMALAGQVQRADTRRPRAIPPDGVADAAPA